MNQVVASNIRLLRELARGLSDRSIELRLAHDGLLAFGRESHSMLERRAPGPPQHGSGTAENHDDTCVLSDMAPSPVSGDARG